MWETWPKNIKTQFLQEDYIHYYTICRAHSWWCSISKSYPTLQAHGLKHSRLPCPSLCPRVCSNSCPLSQRCYLTISSSVTPFSFCLQFFPASGSFLVSHSLHQVARVMEIQLQHQSFQWIFKVLFLLGLTALISLLSQGLSWVFSSTTIWKH